MTSFSVPEMSAIISKIRFVHFLFAATMALCIGLGIILTHSVIIAVMEFPSTIRGLRMLALVSGIYGIIWITSEGQLYRAVIMAFLITSLGTGYLIQRFLSGRVLPAKGWILTMAGLGALFGVSVAILTLVFMAVKTGLHSHGPEFTQEEVSWTIRQIPLWGVAGLVGGLGLGLISASLKKNE
jgi:hypothetical protein